MKALGYEHAGPLSARDALIAFDTAEPSPGPRDLLVEVRGVSVNPVDVKVRQNIAPDKGPRILGFDAAGVVTAVGSHVTAFKVGDEVYYAGDLTRPGTNAQRHCVDERIVGRKPASLGFAEAAAMPLTTITAWEMLFDSFRLEQAQSEGKGEALLVIGGAGGVGSILIQLAKRLTGLTVVATASRDDTRDWVRNMGADHVVNHRNPLDQEMKALGITPRYVAALTNTDQHFSAILQLIEPRGHVALIDDPKALDIKAAKTKALSFSWEFMFARSMFHTPDMHVQHDLLNTTADLLDAGTLRCTVNRHAGQLGVETLRAAHAFQESGQAIGKTVLDGIAH